MSFIETPKGMKVDGFEAFYLAIHLRASVITGAADALPEHWRRIFDDMLADLTSSAEAYLRTLNAYDQISLYLRVASDTLTDDERERAVAVRAAISRQASAWDEVASESERAHMTRLKADLAVMP